MKRLLPLLVLFCTLSTYAQSDYTINGKTYSLKTEVEGTLTLLWNTIDGEYLYFSKKGNDIQALENTRDGKDYKEEYKEVLASQTSDFPVDTKNLALTLGSLRNFFNDYNQRANTDYTPTNTPVKLTLRLGGFLGLTNYPYVFNPDNTSLPQIGVDFELIDETKLPRHAVLFQLRQIFGTSDYDLNFTQFSLNYRFKFIKSDAVDIFINTKISDYTYISGDLDDVDDSGATINVVSSEGEFQVPFAFGLGADIPVGNGFITLGFYDVFALNLDDNGEFPIDFVAGYKINL